MADNHRCSELILNPDGSIYHLALRKEQVAETIILVGDPNRVPVVSSRFDTIEHRVSKREFNTHTGWVGKKRLSVVSTGIGTDNIDIVITELDALFNIDLTTQVVAEKPQRLDFIRLGTSGGLQPECLPGKQLASTHAIGIDGLMHFYKRHEAPAVRKLREDFCSYLDERNFRLPVEPYFGSADSDLLERYGSGMLHGITLSAPGFYGPQGRQIRLQPWREDILDQLAGYSAGNLRLTNIEMETSAIYAMASALGHRALSLNALLANRTTGTFAEDPGRAVIELIEDFLSKTG